MEKQSFGWVFPLFGPVLFSQFWVSDIFRHLLFALFELVATYLFFLYKFLPSYAFILPYEIQNLCILTDVQVQPYLSAQEII